MKFKKRYFLLSIIVGMVIILGVMSLFYVNTYPLKFKNEILFNAYEFNVEASLIASVIYAESSFNEKVISNKGAKGLMQLMPQTAQWICERLDIEYNEEALFKPSYNIRLGTYYLSYLLNKFSNIETALASYNAGEGNVINWLKDEKYSKDGVTLTSIPFNETKAYVEKIIKAEKHYRAVMEKI